MRYSLYQITYICGIKNFHNPLQHWVILPFILLADQFNVPQFAKVEVSLLLQIFNSKFQYIDLPKKSIMSYPPETEFSGIYWKGRVSDFSEQCEYAKHFRSNRDGGSGARRRRRSISYVTIYCHNKHPVQHMERHLEILKADYMK